MSGPSGPARWRAARAVLATELRVLLRDRRALVAAVVLPLLLYPALLFAAGWLRQVSRETLSARTVRIGLDLRAAPDDLARDLRLRLHQELPVELEELDAALPRELARAVLEGRPEALEAELLHARELLGRGFDLLLVAEPHAVLAGRLVFRVRHDGSRELSREARARAERALEGLETRRRAQRIAEVLGEADPAAGLALEAVDVASEADASGLALGRWLPLFAVLVLAWSAAHAALGAFAGEREAGSLETLLAQPAAPAQIALGKLGAVVALALAALACNGGSLLASLELGLWSLPGADPGSPLAAGGERLLLGALVFLPGAVFLCALLALVSARARTFRHGQVLLLPLLLLALGVAGLAGFGGLPLDAATVAAPLLGPCLALRDALAGRLGAPQGVGAFAVGCGWTWLALGRVARALEPERALRVGERAAGERSGAPPEPSGVAWGVGLVAAGYLAGGWLQARHGVAGLLASQWVLLLALAALCARGTARRTRAGWLDAAGLRPASWRPVAGALLCAPAIASAMRAGLALQQRLLPMPLESAPAEGLLAQLQELPPWALFAVLALTPGVCEELAFRGALLGRMAGELRPRALVLAQALLFGAAHASIHRFLPTAILGALLALLTLRARSVLPAIALHVAYDGLLVLGLACPALGDPRLALLALPGLLLFVRPSSPALRPRPAA